MERRTVLQGALTLPVVAGALLTIGAGTNAGPEAAPGASSAGAATPAGSPRSPRQRTWDVEALDRRVHSRRR